jgi:predicted alpha/beta superfamily hydrolase
MKRTLLYVVMLTFVTTVFPQASYEYFESFNLKSKRKIKIQLPKDYDEASYKKYPVVVVFDGDYLFEPVAGQVNLQTYWDDMPESIVVGIMHEKTRFYDAYSDEITGLPIEFGAEFFEFVGQELLPHIDKKYNTSSFRVVVGHNITANLANAFIFKEEPLFSAVVNISPDFTNTMMENTIERLKTIDKDIIYYMSTSKKDVEHIRNSVVYTHDVLNDIENKHLTYYFDEFDDGKHYAYAPQAIAKSLDKIFDLYKPLRTKELKEKVMTFEGTLDNYLKDKYDNIEELFGIAKEIPQSDFEKVARVANKREDAASLQKLGKLANKVHPDDLLGNYYLAQHAEKIGKTKKAKKLYESALELNDVSHIDREFILARVEELTLAENENEDEEEEDEEDEDDTEN